MNSIQLLIATTTFADKASATLMAQRVIQRSAAACAQVEGPIESHYRWQGELFHEIEWRLTMKTTAEALSRLQAIVHESHPYEQPQWLVTPVARSSSGYEAWVCDAVTRETDSKS